MDELSHPRLLEGEEEAALEASSAWDAARLEVRGDVALGMQRWLAACSGVSGAARVSILSRERDVIAALMVSEGQICFGSSSVNGDFVAARLSMEEGERFQRTLREVRLRSVRLGGLSSAERLAERDAEEVQARLRGLMARLIFYIVAAVHGSEGLPPSLTVTRPIDARYVQDRPSFGSMVLFLEAMRQGFGEASDEATRLLGGLSEWAEASWLLGRRADGGRPCLLSGLRVGELSWEEVGALERFAGYGEAGARWALEGGAQRVVSVLNAGEEVWCCAVGVSRVVLFRVPSSRLGMVVSEVQRGGGGEL